MPMLAVARSASGSALLPTRVALVACGTFVAILAGLHVLKPEIDPSWRFISEYAIGPYGWLMDVAFLALAFAYVALARALAPHLRGWPGRAGLVLLLVSAAGLVMAGLFTTDPVTTRPGEATMHGALHNVGGTLGMAMPFAAALVGWTLAKDPAWAYARRRLCWTAAAAVAVFVLSFATLGVMLARSNGAFGPDVHVGWPNRIEILAYCGWLAATAHAVGGIART